MRAGKVQKTVGISKTTLLRRIEDNLTGPVEKTSSGANIFRWKHIIRLAYLEKYNAAKPKKTIISICQNKGGVGKTTSVVNLATAFSYLGKTLVIDLDSQSNLSQSFGFYLAEKDISVSDVFEKPELINSAIRPVPGNENLFVLPNHLKFDRAQRDYNKKANMHFILKRSLKELNQDFNFILIDTPPNLGVALEIALYASDSCIIPFQAHPYALDGILNIIKEIKDISAKDETGNFDPQTLGIFVNNFEQNALFNQVVDQVIKVCPTFKTKISKAVAIPQSQAMKQSIFDYDESNDICLEYYNLFFEIIEKIQG
jgi:chromosome partitioning protein